MYRRGLLSTVALGGLLSGCVDIAPPDGTLPEEEPTPEEDSAPDERAKIVDHRLVRYDVGTEEATVAIEGTVHIYEPDLQHIELRGRFFGDEDEPLDTTFERLRELDVGSQSFEIEYPEVGQATEAVEGYDVEITTIV